MLFPCYNVVTSKFNFALILYYSMFGMVIERLMIPDIQKISGTVERKITAVGLTKLLCEAAELIDGPYSTYW